MVNFTHKKWIFIVQKFSKKVPTFDILCPKFAISNLVGPHLKQHFYIKLLSLTLWTDGLFHPVYIFEQISKTCSGGRIEADFSEI